MTKRTANPTRITPSMTLEQRFDFYVRKSNGCWLWGGPKTDLGYGKLCMNYREKSAHRVAWELYCGPIPDGMFLCHKCDTPSCVRPDHLFLGTQKDNMRDKLAKGRDPYGERNTQAKLTDDKVRRILADVRPRKDIAADYGVSSTMIRFIQTGRKWRHISSGGVYARV